jgi:nucleoside-diphosphate-sugar epimerase
MRLFVTGASGHIGSAICPDLVAAGHTVVGLASTAIVNMTAFQM